MDGLVLLISFRIAASVVDLPEPVAPVTSTSPVFSLEFLDNFRELQVQRGDDGVELAQHDGVIAALGEDVDAEARLVGHGVGGIAGAGAEQVLDVPLIVAIRLSAIISVWKGVSCSMRRVAGDRA